MKNRIKKIVFSLIILVALIFGIGTLPIINVSADSVDLFWIGGTGNWSDTTHWAEYYTVGTATFVNGDATVEFGGGADVTSYDDCIIRVLSTGKWYTIDSITDSDTLELTAPFAEANTGAVAYAIAIGGHAVPTSTNNVYFNIGSFTGASQTVTIDATAYCKDMDWTGATNNPTLSIGLQTLACYGASIVFSADMTINQTSYGWYLNFYGSDTVSITTNGNSINKATVLIQNTKTLSLTEDLSCRVLQVPSGSLVSNNYNITVSENTVGFYIYGASAKSITLGSSTVNVGLWRYDGSNLTLNEGTSTINCSGAFNGNGETYNIVNLTGATSTISGSNTFAELNLDDTKTQTITFTDGTTQTAASFSLSGSAGHIHTLKGSAVGGWNLAYSGGSYLSFDYLSVSRSSVTPATNIWYAGTHSTNGGNNTGWFFIAPDAPTVTTQAASGILVLEATINGTITNKGALNTTLQYGFDIGTTAGVYTDSYVTVGDYSGAFLELVDGLLEHTTYYYRAKAQNNVGWGYGSEVSFTTGTETWSYYLEFTVQDTSGTDRTNVPVILSSLVGSNLVNAGYIDSDGLDTNLKETTTAIEYLLSTTNGAMVIPNLAASQTRTYRLYMNDWQGQHGFPIIVGDEGYMTVLDAAALELGDSFEIEISGYIDTAAGANKNIVFKDGSFLLYISAEDTVSARMYSSASPTVVSTSTDTQSNHTSGFNTSDVNLPADLVSGNLILVIGTYARDYTMDTPAGWTLLYNETYGNFHNFCIYKVSDGSEGATVTITFGDYLDDLVTISYQISDYSGVPVTNTVATGTSSNPDPSSITTGFDNIVSLFIAVEGHLGNYTVSNYPTNYASGLSARNVYYTVATAQRALTAASEDVGAFTISGSTGWIAKTIAIQGTYVEVSEAALVSDDYIIKVTADGTDLKLFIDGVEADSAALGGINAVDNANNWVLFGGNSMSYVNYYKQTVSGTLIAHYQPASMITSTTVPDLEGAAQNGTITWGTNSNLTITMMGITPYVEYVSESGADDIADTIKPATMPDTWYSDITDIADLPFYETFNEKATEMGMPTQTLYVMMMLGTAVAVGLGVLVFTGSALVAVLTCGVTIAAGVNTGILSGWMLLIFFIFGIGILYLSRQN